MGNNRFYIHDRTIYDLKLQKELQKIRNYIPSKEELLRHERKQKLKNIFGDNL